MNSTTTLDHFSVGDQIGRGTMGTVYHGTHRQTDVPVAIKVLDRMADEEAHRRFHRGIQAHAGLAHPGIVYLFEYGEVDEASDRPLSGPLNEGSPFVAMELARRGAVRDHMPFDDWKTVCRLLIQVLDALAYAHARDVIHRDLKPENFLWFETGEEPEDWRIKLADFGIAYAYDREQTAETQELERPAGTPYYMPPEQLWGQWRSYGP